nr:immunoglobulin light chain junction region [Macaca mulatta]MOW18627.1 immunoglobulin light chain junction region [Macaca mulatta]
DYYCYSRDTNGNHGLF